VRSNRATYEKDPETLLAVVCELGSLPPDPELAQPFFDNYEAIFGWLMGEEPCAADPSRTGEMMRRYTAMRAQDGFDDLVLPAEHFVVMRAVMLLIGLLGQLGATNTWFDIGREWVLGDEPVTELGRQEQTFFAGRHDYTTAVAA
jgi:hypothetical protein